MVYRDAEEVRDLKIKAREAVELAMGGRWEEAVALNREVIATSPSDLGAYNRLGKALLELGDPQAARGAFEHSLSLDPSNPIARKNIERLSDGTACGGSAPLSHKMFIGETGKSAQVALLGCATFVNQCTLCLKFRNFAIEIAAGIQLLKEFQRGGTDVRNKAAS